MTEGITVTLTQEEAQAMLDHTDQEGLSLVGDQYRHVYSAKDKIAEAMKRTTPSG